MDSKQIVADMRKLTEDIESLEGKRKDAEGDERKVVIAEMIEGKNSEFKCLEEKLAEVKETERRAKLMAEIEAEQNQTEGKAEKMEDVTVEAKNEHNETNHDIEHTKAFTAYVCAERPSQALNEIAGKKGENFIESIRPSRNDAAGVLMPAWMRDIVAPQPTSAAFENALLAKMGGKASSNNVLVRDASGTNSGGGSLVDVDFVTSLYQIKPRTDDIAQRCFVKRAVGKEAQFPRLDQSSPTPFGIGVTWGNGGAANGEGNALSESNPVFNRLDIGTERLGLFSQMSLNKVRVNDVGVEGELAMMYRGAATRAISTAILEGVAGVTNAPTGINTNAQITAGVNVTARETAAQVSYADLVKMIFAADDGIFDEGIFVLSAGGSGSMQYIASLDDTAGRPIFGGDSQSGWGVGRAPSIAGRPYISTLSNTKAVGSRGDVIYGSFGNYGLVIDTDNMAIERSDDFAFTSGLCTYRMILYVGGQPLGPNAFTVLGDASGVSSSSSSSSS